MKKLLIILFGILFLCGCNYDKQVEPIKDNIVNDVKEEVKEEYEDNNPIKVGLFLMIMLLMVIGLKTHGRNIMICMIILMIIKLDLILSLY